MTGAELTTCPQCGAATNALSPVDTGMRVALSAAGMTDSIPDQVCPRCYEALSGKVSQGVRLRIERENREKNKMMLWKNRVNLIKQARQLMSAKSYSEAAVSYEKYLRVLEVVYNLKKGELSPDIFNKSKRSKELTVVASVYWDLMRIYDTSPRYGDRMQKSAQKLAEFLPFSSIYPDIVKKAESFLRASKNPNVVRSFLKAIKGGKSGCFIATAAFEDPFASEVEFFRHYRDQVLMASSPGRKFSAFYYRYSPFWARALNSQSWLKPFVRFVLKALAQKLASKKNPDSPFSS